MLHEARTFFPYDFGFSFRQKMACMVVQCSSMLNKHTKNPMKKTNKTPPKIPNKQKS